MTELVKIRSGKWELSGVVHAPSVTPPKRVGVVLLHENCNTKFGTCCSWSNRDFGQITFAHEMSDFCFGMR